MLTVSYTISTSTTFYTPRRGEILMSKKAVSAKGLIVDFDLLQIKEQMAKQPRTATVQARENFVDRKFRRRMKQAVDSIPPIEVDKPVANKTEPKPEQKTEPEKKEKKMTCPLRPLHNQIIVQFLEQQVGPKGYFERYTKSGIVLPAFESHADTIKTPRWAKVCAIGPKCDPILAVEGCEILIEPLMWTQGMEVKGRKYWRTDQTKVVGYRYPEDGKDEEPLFHVDPVWDKAR